MSSSSVRRSRGQGSTSGSHTRRRAIALVLFAAAGPLLGTAFASGAAAPEDESRLLSTFLASDAKSESLLSEAARVLARDPAGQDPSLRSIARSIECRGFLLRSDTRQAESACAQARQLSVGGSDAAVFAAERMAGLLALERGTPVAAVAALLASYAAATRIGDELATATALFTLGSAAQFAGANADAIDYYDRAQALATRIGAHILRSRIANNLGVLLLESGDPEGARVQFLDAIDAARSAPGGYVARAAAYALALAEMELGQVEDAAGRIRALIDERHPQETPAQRGEAQLQLARAEFRAGRIAKAAAAARMAVAILGPSHPTRAFPAEALLVAILVADGKFDAAERLTEQLLQRIPEDARGRIELLEARAGLLAASGRHRDAYRVALDARRVREQQSTTRSSQALAFMRARAQAQEQAREVADLRAAGELAGNQAAQARTVRNLSLALLVVTIVGAVALLWLARARRQLEAEVERRRNLDALGKLTGGVAHDFNTLMTIVRQSMGLLRRDVGIAASPAALSLVDEADSAARLGGEITTQLLTFARQQRVRPEVVSVEGFFRDRKSLFERALGDAMQLDIDVAARDSFVRIDPGQLATAVINLLTNARDAMDGRGRVRMTVEPFRNGVRDRRWMDLPPGPYVCMSIIDTGVGMSTEVQRQATTPFFTTKGVQGGSGLGLSTVQGFVAQSGGTVQFDSLPGRGTTVTLVLPACNPPRA